MLDIKLIRNNPKIVAEKSKQKGYAIDIDKLLKVDEERRKLIEEVDKLRSQRKAAAEKRDEKEGARVKSALRQKEDRLEKLSEEFYGLVRQVPNLPKEDVKVGKDESENEVIREVGKKPKFDFKPKNHLELGEALDLIDVEKASKVSGTRFGYLKNEAVLLEFALVRLALETLTKEGFLPVVPPVLIKKEITESLGYWQAGGHEDYYWVLEPKETAHGFYLIGTAEHSIVPMHTDEVLGEKDLPRRYVAFSSCFRREAGSYGKDTRGILRVHQFDKVEMVSFTKPDDDDKEHEFLLSMEEKLFGMLKIPYKVVKMCTADLGFPVARKYDLEAWIPSENKYREVTSTSTTTDFQARRLNIRFKDGKTQGFVHILNATAFAIGRTLIAIMENYQQKDGTIRIPKALQKYTGFSQIPA